MKCAFSILLLQPYAKPFHIPIPGVSPRQGCSHGPLVRYVKLRVVHAPGMAGTFSPPPRVSDPEMHHGTCVSHVPWCMPGSLTSGFPWSRWRENVPGIPGTCAIRNVRYLVRGPLVQINSINSRWKSQYVSLHSCIIPLLLVNYTNTI